MLVLYLPIVAVIASAHVLSPQHQLQSKAPHTIRHSDQYHAYLENNVTQKISNLTIHAVRHEYVDQENRQYKIVEKAYDSNNPDVAMPSTTYVMRFENNAPVTYLYRQYDDQVTCFKQSHISIPEGQDFAYVRTIMYNGELADEYEKAGMKVLVGTWSRKWLYYGGEDDDYLVSLTFLEYSETVDSKVFDIPAYIECQQSTEAQQPALPVWYAQ